MLKVNNLHKHVHLWLISDPQADPVNFVLFCCFGRNGLLPDFQPDRRTPPLTWVEPESASPATQCVPSASGRRGPGAFPSAGP